MLPRDPLSPKRVRAGRLAPSIPRSRCAGFISPHHRWHGREVRATPGPRAQDASRNGGAMEEQTVTGRSDIVFMLDSVLSRSNADDVVVILRAFLRNREDAAVEFARTCTSIMTAGGRRAPGWSELSRALTALDALEEEAARRREEEFLRELGLPEATPSEERKGVRRRRRGAPAGRGARRGGAAGGATRKQRSSGSRHVGRARHGPPSRP